MNYISLASERLPCNLYLYGILSSPFMLVCSGLEKATLIIITSLKQKQIISFSKMFIFSSSTLSFWRSQLSRIVNCLWYYTTLTKLLLILAQQIFGYSHKLQDFFPKTNFITHCTTSCFMSMSFCAQCVSYYA